MRNTPDATELTWYGVTSDANAGGAVSSNAMHKAMRIAPAYQNPSRRSAGKLLSVFDEGAVAQLGVGLAQLFGRVHHDRSLPRHRLLERLSRHEQEPDPRRSRLHRDLVAAIEQNEGPIAHHVFHFAAIGLDAVGGDRLRL